MALPYKNQKPVQNCPLLGQIVSESRRYKSAQVSSSYLLIKGLVKCNLITQLEEKEGQFFR